MGLRFLKQFTDHTKSIYIEILDLPKKSHQVALLVRKVESKHENENISTGESLSGVPMVSKNQKLSTEYDFNSFEVSFEVLTE